MYLFIYIEVLIFGYFILFLRLYSYIYTSINIILNQLYIYIFIYNNNYFFFIWCPFRELIDTHAYLYIHDSSQHTGSSLYVVPLGNSRYRHRFSSYVFIESIKKYIYNIFKSYKKLWESKHFIKFYHLKNLFNSTKLYSCFINIYISLFWRF